MAVERIAGTTGRGVVSFITNRKWLSGRFYPAMRESLARDFQKLSVDDLHGSTDDATHPGDQSIFTTGIAGGIKRGTAIVTAVRTGEPAEDATAEVELRDHWGPAAVKRADLATLDMASGRQPISATKESWWRLSARVSGEAAPVDDYLGFYWSGVQPVRDEAVVDIDVDVLRARMRDYFDPSLTLIDVVSRHPGFGVTRARYDAARTRNRLLASSSYRPERVVRVLYRPFDMRWMYWEPDAKLLNAVRRNRMADQLLMPGDDCLDGGGLCQLVRPVPWLLTQEDAARGGTGGWLDRDARAPSERGGGSVSIAGSPVGVEDAAATLERAGEGFTDAADSIASHARAVTAHWIGSAADAAFDAITALANRTRVGADVAGGAAPVLRVYAAELSAAQDAYEAAAASAAAGAGAVQVASAQQDAATAMPTTTPQQRAAQQSASAAAQAAATRAAGQVTSAGHSMVAAVARAEQANQVAADAIDALTAQLADMNTSSVPAPAPPPPPPGSGHHDHPHGGHHDHGHHGHHGWVYNAFGGFGDGAWKLGPGAIGDLVGLIPTDATHHFAGWVESGHDALERDYGADTSAYQATSTTTQIAGFFIPGADVVDGLRVATGAERAAEVGARAGRAAKATADRGDEWRRIGGHTGARSAEEWDAILARAKDPASLKAFALRNSYAEVRAGFSSSDAEAISKSSGMSVADVDRVQRHLFTEEHPLDEGLRRFDVDPDIADAWRRLNAGHPEPADVDLLRHELTESRHMADNPDATYRQAHEAVKAEGFTWAPPDWQDVLNRTTGG